MSSRALRKLRDQQRPAEAHAAIPEQSVANDEDDSGDDEVIQPAQKSNLFDLLGGGDSDSNRNDDDDDDPRPLATVPRVAAPKPKPVPSSDDEPEAPVAPQAPKKSKKSKPKKKKGGKSAAKQEAVEAVDDLDEIDRTIQEINAKYGKVAGAAPLAAASSSKQADSSSSLASLLSVDARHMDADAEMRRMFGSKIIEEEIKKKRYVRMTKKMLFATPRDTWPRIDKIGITMDVLRNEDGCTYYTFVHSKAYQDAQCRFLDCLRTHDPNTISMLLQMQPYHVDALLQMSEVYRHSGDQTTATEYIERALFCFERAFHTMFNVATGRCRLDYRRVENRPFFLAVFRHMKSVAQRGCWRTAFELAKLLLSLEPEQDPLGVLLCIDFYALKAGEYKWLLQFWQEFEVSKELFLLPNMMCSVALAHFMLEEKNQQDHDESSRFLQKAILYYPTLVGQLLDNTAPIASTVLSDAQFTVSPSQKTLQVLLDLCSTYSRPLWKQPEVLAWMNTNISAVLGMINDLRDPLKLEGEQIRATRFNKDVPRSICRHIVVSEFNALMSALSGVARSGISMNDPLPPDDAVHSVYDDYAELHRSANPLGDIGNAVLGLLQRFNINPNNVDGQLVADIQRQLIEAQEGEGHATVPGNFPAEGSDEQVSWVEQIQSVWASWFAGGQSTDHDVDADADVEGAASGDESDEDRDGEDGNLNDDVDGHGGDADGDHAPAE
ncbi:transcriptional repressor TCF25-domain-containing protein [Polychytrium aggregatum]|uniref:transcriptional repressor TCF25-domain-containing protein n=1 Tax=Polychytrium aggregatum TaxID=110093 RepID=UPI0022FE6E10|nr:transcriptional repressor TCF25-domain-containing protein [Polychytrium aggregatum]KAI9202059.1 transcriptional repressor TCF25-domain-containing protein [Polychytrium aggregatum]